MVRGAVENSGFAPLEVLSFKGSQRELSAYLLEYYDNVLFQNEDLLEKKIIFKPSPQDKVLISLRVSYQTVHGKFVLLIW